MVVPFRMAVSGYCKCKWFRVKACKRFADTLRFAVVQIFEKEDKDDHQCKQTV